MKYRIALAKSKRGMWYWRLMSRNGQTLATSEEYVSKRSMMRTVNSVWLRIAGCGKEW